MIPWDGLNAGNRLPDDMRPERPEPEPKPEPEPEPEDEVLMTDSPTSPPGYQRTEEPPVGINYGRKGRELRWPHRKITDG